MKNNYYFNEEVKKAKNNLIDCVESTKKRIELLRSIKRVYKKDGSSFQNFLKNFNSNLPNFTIHYSYSDIIARNYPTEVYIKRFRIRSYGKDEYFEKIEKENPERIIREYGFMDKVELTLDEIMENIKEDIKREEKHLIEYENQLKNFDENVEKLEKLLDPLEEFLFSLGEGYYKFKCIIEAFGKGRTR